MASNVVRFAEVFPIQMAAVPQLYAYQPKLRGGDTATIGGKLSYRLRRDFRGHWAVTQGRVLGDLPLDDVKLAQAVRGLKAEHPEVFKDLLSVSLTASWRPPVQSLADFVARGLFADLHADISRVLGGLTQDLGLVRVERLYDVRGWAVQNVPALSISIASRLVAKQPFAAYARQARSRQELVNIWVADITSTLKGPILEVIGTVGELREHLLSLKPRDEVRVLIEGAPDDELVVRVQAGRTGYDYVVSALRHVVRTEDYARFGVSPQRASQVLHIAPAARADVVAKVSQLAKSRGIIAATAYRSVASAGEARNSRRSPEIFLGAREVGFDGRIRIGKNVVITHEERALSGHLRRQGVYRRSAAFNDAKPIRIGIVQALPANGRQVATTFVQSLRDELRNLSFASEIVSEEIVTSTARVDLERSYNAIAAADPHLLLALLPGAPGTTSSQETLNFVWGPYQHIKSLAVGRGMPSQVVYQRTMSNTFALSNIALGVISKTGSVPFILADPLPYADMVVGIDIARRRKDRLQGSMNATAIARIYMNTGDFLRYVIHDAPLEGETIPGSVLQSLFPLHEFQGKRVVIHRDGYFRGDERQVLLDWATSIGATFHLVEVIKSGTPRLYQSQDNVVQQPDKGTALRLSDTEAFLVSSLPPYKNVTPNPLHVRTSPSLSIEQAIHSILAMTVLHHGSLKAPRLPVTIHYSDEIAYLALMGIKPKDLEGTVPYWL